jgi:hypothetical protein
MNRFREVAEALRLAVDECDRLTGMEAMSANVAAKALTQARAATERHRDLTSRLGFGDGITEPQADNDTIVRLVQEQRWAKDAAEHQRDEWRRARDDLSDQLLIEQHKVDTVRGLLAAYGEAEGTPTDYEFLVHQISTALEGR